ncbi:MAG: hypothetical protein KDK64_08450 [Chlamydiia bacterium]|nr:hypothetical protein [Chlamydiia bacterium]
MERVERRLSHEDVLHPVVREGKADLEVKEEKVEEGVYEQREGEASTVSYSSGGTFLDMAWNVGVGLWRMAFDSGADRREQVQERMDTKKYSVAQTLANVLKPVDVGCAVGGTAELLAPYFREGKPFEIYLPRGCGLDEFAIGLENPQLTHNAVRIGIYRDFLHTFSDNLRDDLLPLMGSQSVPLEQKVLELHRLVHLEDQKECESTVVVAFITCFDKLSVEEQNRILEGHYQEAEKPLGALRSSENVDYIKDTLLPGFLGKAERVDLDWACLQRMQHYQGLNQPGATQSFYQSLSPATKSKLVDQEVIAQERKSKDSRPIPGQAGYTYFNKTPVGAVAKKALNALIAGGKEDLLA